MKISIYNKSQDILDYFNKKNFILDYFNIFNFSDVLEKSKSVSKENGWEPYHILIQGENSSFVVIPSYIKDHSWLEFSFDHPFAEAASKMNLNYYPKLQICFPYIPTSSSYLLGNFDSKDITIRNILYKLVTLAEEKFSSVHFTFPTNFSKNVLEEFGFIEKYHTQYIWENKNYDSFGQFIESFISKARHNILNERRFIREQGVTIEALRGEEIQESDLQELYLQIKEQHIRKNWGEVPFNLSFLEIMLKKMNSNMLVLFAKLGNRIIGGSLNFINGKKIYGRFWGASEEMKYLHYELCYYSLIEYAIGNGYESIEVGCVGEHKISRGFFPYIVSNYHWISDLGLRKEAIEITKIHNVKILNENKVTKRILF